MNKYMQLLRSNEHLAPLNQRPMIWALLAVAQAMYDTDEFHRDVEEMKKEALIKAVITTGKKISISEPVYAVDLDNV